MRRDTWIQIAAGACMLAFFAGSMFTALKISASSGRNRLVYTETAEAGDPPQVALGIAMGAFRGLFVNYLWMRANDLKEAGKYYEAVDLSRTITRLQPRFPKVWQFHAWNLAYNISVSTQTPSERWHWVNSGIRLLRSDGIRACPNDLGIHRELAWILIHKVQGFMDDAHRYYKREFAHEWSVVMGAPPRSRLTDLGQTGEKSLKQDYADRWLTPIVEAPDSLEELLKKDPKAQALIAEIRSKAGLDLDMKFLERFAEVDAVIAAAAATGVQPDMTRDPLAEIILSGKYPVETGKLVVAYTRKRILREEYNMEPERMIRYTLYYGPLDWRHPAAHAVYWSARGVEETLLRVNEGNKRDFDILNTDRITIQSIQELFRSGTVTYDVTNPTFYFTLPNTEYVDSYKRILDTLMARSDYEKDQQRTYRFYAAGYENFMKDAIRYLYRRGDIDAATKYKKELLEWPGQNINDSERNIKLAMPLDEWVQREIVDDNRETSPVVATQEIIGALQAAYINGLLANDNKRFVNEFNYARLFHEQYQQTQAFKTWVTGPEGRLGFPAFDLMSSQIFAGLIEAAGIPQGPIMFKRAPADLQGQAYVYLERSKLRQFLAGVEKQGGAGFDVWFPEPAGVDFFRQRMFPNEPAPTKANTEVR
jgi:hypothetical protein